MLRSPCGRLQVGAAAPPPPPPRRRRGGAQSQPPRSWSPASGGGRAGSAGFNPEGREQGRAAPLPAAMPFAPSAPVAVAWLSCELCPRGAPVCDRGPAVTLGQTSLMWSLLLNPGLGPPRERPRPAPCSPPSPGQSPSGRPHRSLARGPQGGAGRRSEPSGPVVAHTALVVVERDVGRARLLLRGGSGWSPPSAPLQTHLCVLGPNMLSAKPRRVRRSLRSRRPCSPVRERRRLPLAAPGSGRGNDLPRLRVSPVPRDGAVKVSRLLTRGGDFAQGGTPAPPSLLLPFRPGA